MMKRAILILCMMCVVAIPLSAQEWSAEQSEVWQTISKQWDLEMAQDDAWMDMLHPSFLGWIEDVPIPHDKETTTRFIRAEAGRFRTVAQTIQPVGIVVIGDTAVVHYYGVGITEYIGGEQEGYDGRYTDVLTRTADGWKFLSMSGSERSEDDDVDD